MTDASAELDVALAVGRLDRLEMRPGRRDHAVERRIQLGETVGHRCPFPDRVSAGCQEAIKHAHAEL